LDAFRNEFKNLDDSAKIDAKYIKKHSNVLIEEEILARMELLRKHTDAYRTILKIFNDLTNNMTTGVKFQRNEVKIVYKLATGELTWDKLDDQGKKSITWKPDLSKAIDLIMQMWYHLSQLIGSLIMLKKVKSLSMKVIIFRTSVNV